ncbi:class I SAM-dependent RNA methyltransferase [Ponticoccus sp. SC2-23]|uniref:THUMP domain-containing class I SAM-dependent RNA methyltransferase n=1 Tax=Alexandriicola marinus TaxID=2081710 RepID=UPI000FD8C212|nr:class I SAM-dependent RNA methyltransferase [Alexandriicola marinus]MBM1222138.1 class I SAM-dependent RNA methyltransferase [Ponticoccus sp. SC6-9]MBM1226825.1 class I SAM-dependent RNA methyltransferase [Ponticoccus sp. SC6-15]MBM1231085.1 class I SAM-dependent RNA methyltransferase [Ponticoccus sp. SC6-38]MBM1235663.1 class I SAM-dependent RNA methyltransferase [Ponticoccus sp. SC6-45]MBM1240107.1 class I SAM-dependent RNA methyltransferase [Ponticoccus sp. SC6-49]MBM1244461.1 class I S
MKGQFEIFLMGTPGLEPGLEAEAREAGFAVRGAVPGGVTLTGGWRDVMRANLELRGAGRVLARVASFKVMNLPQLHERTEAVDWAALLRTDVPIRVDATCKASKIYHQGAVAERVGHAIARQTGVQIGADGLSIKVRIEQNRATISVDTSGEPLHRRGHKEAVGKAPLRETLAALFLRECGYRGDEPVIDPMCGSGTFVLEAAEIALGLQPGRDRAFDFEKLALFDPDELAAQRRAGQAETPHHFRGYDRDRGVIEMAQANAVRAGVDGATDFAVQSVSDLRRPDGPPGLVIVNPPYGARIGTKSSLQAVYGALGRTLSERFSGWRVGLVTSEPSLAKATKLPGLKPGVPVPHGALKVQLWQTGPLP